MGGGISVVAVEARFEGDPHDRRCILEAMSPLQLASTLTMGNRHGIRGPSFITFGPAGFTQTSNRMSGADAFGSLALTGRDSGEVQRPGYEHMQGSYRGANRCHLWSMTGPTFRSRAEDGGALSSTDANLANRAAGERIIQLAEALFRMLDETERQLSSQQQKGPQPAPTTIVEHLSTRKYRAPSPKGKSEEEDHECYICLSEYCEGETIRILPCKHEFHAACVDKWLKEVHRVCPLCRSSVCTTRETQDEGQAPRASSSRRIS
mmetsp:Transcript_11971/g.20216  ORF Transcript_11971/g.20216 Transcript_11971/m.20216 type:complete len:264 (-) Transcript_11971:711-1502(-)